MSFTLDTKKFEGSVKELSSLSNSSMEKQVWYNARMILRSIAFNSPKQTGAMNAGWIPAWSALKIPGRPNTKLNSTEKVKLGRKKISYKYPQGKVEDNRKSAVPHIIMTNTTHEIRADGKKIFYPAIVEARQNFMRKAEAEIASKFEYLIHKKLGQDAKRSGF